jgi:ribosomal-protein-alanine N-acetyltransferase
MILNGALCSVRSWRSSDIEALVLHANNLEVARHLRDRFPHPYTRADATAFLRHAAPSLGAVAPERPTNLAIEISGEVGGGIGFVRGTDVERFSAEIGYWLGEHYWGRGIVTEALTLVSDYAFRSFNLLRLFALPFEENIASVRVLEKAGYVREGLLRSSSVKFGKPRDQYIYAKLNPDWRFE